MSRLITSTNDLEEFCRAAESEDFVTIDTEFMRERTYWPKLCLVQLATSSDAVAIDPLVPDLDLEPLRRLLNNGQVIKVFHAARQDVEIFVNMFNRVPAPLYDTQVAAMVCGFGESASYETLAGKLAGAVVDKSSRFTDWAHRPLTQRQIDYAIADVTHLRIVYQRLDEMIKKSGRAEWVQDEMAVVNAISTYQVDPQEVWKRLKLRIDKPKLRTLVREVAAWRELEAQRIDVPRSRVMRDEALMEIVHHPPTNAEQLARIRGLSNHFAESRQGEELLRVVARAQAMPNDDKGEIATRRRMPSNILPVVELLKVVLKQVSDEHDIAPRLLASSDDIEAIACDDNADVPAMKGWRRQLFGDVAVRIKQGELALRVVHGKVKLQHVAATTTDSA